MNYTDEFRDPVAAKGVLAAIENVVTELGATKEKPVHALGARELYCNEIAETDYK